MSHFKRIFGHNQAEIFPVKPLPPIFLGPPTHNGAIAARGITPGVYAPPVIGSVYVPPPSPPPETEILPPPPATGTVWGIISDCASGRPLKGATVILDGITDHTTEEGKYEYRNIAPGPKSLYVFLGEKAWGE